MNEHKSLSHEDLESLKKLRYEHFALAKKVARADNNNVYMFDILINATLNRSICLLKGFISLIHTHNLVVAAPLIRLQIDNCLRLHAASLVSDPHKFALQVLEGIQIKDIKDRTGHKLSDKYLVDKLTEQIPWVRDVYLNTSGYIHLSDKHIYNSLNPGKNIGSLKMKITDTDAFVSDEVYCGAILDFRRSTNLLFHHVNSWAMIKENPEIVAQKI